MIKTPIYEFNQPQGNDAVDIEVLNENIRKIDDILNLKVDNSKKSDSVTLGSSDSVATSKAVKVAYDKGVEALGKASRNESSLTEKANKTGSLSIADENNILPNQLNILTYNNGGSNFAGVGGNPSGEMIFTVGTSGVHKASFKVSGSNCYINGKKALTQDDYTTLQAGIDGCFKPSNYGAIAYSNGNYLIDISLANRVVYGGGIITVPANVFPIGTQITFINWGGTNFSFVPASGVQLFSKDSKRIIDGEFSSATLVKTETNGWALIGALK